MGTKGLRRNAPHPRHHRPASTPRTLALIRLRHSNNRVRRQTNVGGAPDCLETTRISMRLNRPQSLHSNTNCPPLPENAGTYLSKPFEHPYTNQNSGSNPSILCKSFAKAPSFFLKHGGNGGKQGLFFSQRLYFLALLREVRAAWPLIESAAEWETSSLRMKDEKNGTIRKEPRQLPFRTTCCSSRQPLSSPFPPRRPTTWRTRRHKNARGEKALL